MRCLSSGKKIQILVRDLFESESNESQRKYTFEKDSSYFESSSLLINAKENCPVS